MHTFDKVLWLKAVGDTITYRVTTPDKFLLYGWVRVGNFGQLASRYRKQGEKAMRTKLPEVPKEVWDSIIAVAKYQDTWAERQASEPPSKYADAGKWDD